jgi:hypothetical protein
MWGENPPPPQLLSGRGLGGQVWLIKIWMQTEGPQYSLDFHTDLWHHCGSHLVISIIFSISPLQHPQRKSNFTLFIGLSLCPFSKVPWLPKDIFWLSFEHLWPPLTWSTLPPWLPLNPSNLSRLVPCSPPRGLAYLGCLLTTAHAFQPPCLAITRTLASWVVFCYHSHGPASPSDCHKKDMIWVDLIQKSPTAFIQIFPLSSSWASF